VNELMNPAEDSRGKGTKISKRFQYPNHEKRGKEVTNALSREKCELETEEGKETRGTIATKRKGFLYNKVYLMEMSWGRTPQGGSAPEKQDVFFGR